MNEYWKAFVDFFTSLKLTVVLLALSIILIFWATIAQVQLGVWGVQEHFFRTFFVLNKIPGTDVPVPVFPGGYFIGGLLLINLVAAHIHRFKFTWGKLGIQLTHIGLILLLIGEILTSIWQEEYQMRLDEGQTKNYSESYRDNELAIIDTTDPEFDDVVAIPEGRLAPGKEVQHPKLPFRVLIRDYYPNAALQMRDEVPDAPNSIATQDIGARIHTTPLPLTYKQDERNLGAAYVELVGPQGTLGTWLVSTQLLKPQTFDYGGRTFSMALRFARKYKPYSLNLIEFRHDVYAGTTKPKNFSSKVRLMTPDGQDDREVLIYMNNPLRYSGLTFYQASFIEGSDTTTILQVVDNPSWILPYISCTLMGVGLLIQFLISLFRFSNRRAQA